MLSDITIECEDRWQVYYRLQELGIKCQCGGFKPLQVTLQTPTEAVQLWSIVQRVSAPRQALIQGLHRSWRSPYRR